MKIGLLTFHNVMNIGANLQCYSLCKYINENHHYCEIIDYSPFKPKKNDILRKVYRALKKLRTKDRHFLYFQKHFYNLSRKKYFSEEELILLNNEYTIFISGSDQIFNTDLSNKSKAYYLSFVNNENKKISYASSFGKEKINECEKKYIGDYLKRFDFLSCREQTGIDNINSIIRFGKDIPLVVDPVFLLEKKEWDKLCSKKCLRKDYVLFYLMENNNSIEKVANYFKSKLGLKVLLTKGSKFNCYLDNCAKIIKTTGPLEFLLLVKNAKYIVTNSFHGLAMSIIFERKIIPLRHSKRNTRLENLLNMSNYSGCFFDEEKTIEDCIINGRNAYARIVPLIQKSKDYLSKSLRESK